MNNYNSNQHNASHIPPAALLFSPMMTTENSHAEEYATSKKESWRNRWQSQPVSKENQEQKWRRQGKLK